MDMDKQDLNDIGSLQRFELQNGGTGYQSFVNLKIRILGRSSDQNNGAVFYKRQERILLKLIETMDLINEEYCFPAF